MDEDRPRIIERVTPAGTPEETRQRRSSAMIGTGVLALLFGVVGAANGAAIGFLIALLGIALLVGGLVIRS
jgi:predicted lipid-binding transport protein (Tim44 family)